MNFSIDHNGFRVDLTGRVREDALKISTLFPGERVVVWAHARARFVLRDGAVEVDNDNYRKFYVETGQEQELNGVSYAQASHEWTHLVVD